MKRIFSIGGWAFSTDVDIYQIFRNAVTSEDSRATLVSNVVDFLNDNDLDGVDWDWECKYCLFLSADLSLLAQLYDDTTHT